MQEDMTYYDELSKVFEETITVARKKYCCVKSAAKKESIFCGICFDQAVGGVRNILTNKRIEKTNRKDIKGQYDTNHDLRRLILVLESPHKDEFDEKGKSLGPAQGEKVLGTAYGIIHYLEPIVGTLCDGFLERELILVNAVRFQCSQGLSLRGKGCEFNGKMKERVFEELLERKEFIDDFIVRLRRVYRRACGDIVVNAVGMNSLTSCKVGRLIQNVTGQCSCGIGHPSAWNSSWRHAQQLAREIFKK